MLEPRYPNPLQKAFMGVMMMVRAVSDREVELMGQASTSFSHSSLMSNLGQGVLLAST